MSRPLKVTYFINSLEQGGAERQLAELICGLDPARFEPSLIVCNAKDQLGYKLPIAAFRSLDAPMFPTPVSLHRLKGELDALRPDVFHSFMGWENIFGRAVARQSGVPAIVSSVRCTRLPRPHVLGEALTHRWADAIVVNSVGIRDELVRRASVPPSRIDVVVNGVDLRRFAPLSEGERQQVRRDLGFTEQRVFVLPGRVCEQKNQEALVGALGRLRRRGKLPADVRFVFAGRESHWVYGAKVRGLIARYRLGEQVILAGVVNPVARLLGASDAVVLPSLYEGLPNAVIEAMACATPVIVSPPANADNLVTEGVEGLLFRGTDEESLAEGLERLFGMGAAGLRAMGEKGSHHVRKRFFVDRMVADTVAIYDRILGTRTSGPRTIHRTGGRAVNGVTDHGH